MMKKKTLISALLAISILFGVTACSTDNHIDVTQIKPTEQETTQEETTKTEVGSWKDAEHKTVPANVLGLYKKATKDDEKYEKLTPTELLAIQEVAGTNYKLKLSDDSIVILYVDLNNNCSLLDENYNKIKKEINEEERNAFIGYWTLDSAVINGNEYTYDQLKEMIDEEVFKSIDLSIFFTIDTLTLYYEGKDSGTTGYSLLEDNHSLIDETKAIKLHVDENDVLTMSVDKDNVLTVQQGETILKFTRKSYECPYTKDKTEKSKQNTIN